MLPLTICELAKIKARPIPDSVDGHPADTNANGLHPRHGGEDKEEDDPGVDDIVHRKHCRRHHQQQVYKLQVIWISFKLLMSKIVS